MKFEKRLLNATTIFSFAYAIVPMYAAIFGYWSPGQALVLSIPSCILFCVCLHIKK